MKEFELPASEICTIRYMVLLIQRYILNRAETSSRYITITVTALLFLGGRMFYSATSMEMIRLRPLNARTRMHFVDDVSILSRAGTMLGFRDAISLERERGGG